MMCCDIVRMVYYGIMRMTGGIVPRRSHSVPKRAANVSVRADLLIAAREAGVNLSATLERALTKALAEVKRKKWREDNRDAIAAYNEHIEKQGAFSDDVRSF
jgi:antitoxin CcdA